MLLAAVAGVAAVPSSDFDLLVIGAGPAGVEAAAASASYGLRVGLVERQARVTGAPSGAHSKEVREAITEGARTFPDVSRVIGAAGDRAQASTEERLRELGVVTLSGDATFVDARTVSVATARGRQVVAAASAIIATGSHAFRLGSLPFDSPGVFDSDTISSIDYLPRRLVVQGGGSIGLEYALLFAKLGAQVTVVEIMPQILSQLDSSLREATLASLNDAGVEVFVNSSVDSVTEAARDDQHSIAWQPSLSVQIGANTVESDCFLSSIGRRSSVEGLGVEALQQLGLKLGHHNAIETDERQRTGVDGIYAIGDVTGASLATVGTAQAIIAVKDLVSSRKDLASSRPGRVRAAAPQAAVPAGLWTMPSVSWAGLTEEEAAAQNLTVDVARVEYNATVRGWISGESGFLKLVYSRSSGEVLGAHIFGETSMELVGFGAEAINSGRTIFDLLDYVLPAATLSQIYHKAAEKAWLTSFKGREELV